MAPVAGMVGVARVHGDHQRRAAPRPVFTSVETPGAEGVGYTPATERSAAASAVGRALPRFSARRRIPAHAFGLK